MNCKTCEQINRYGWCYLVEDWVCKPQNKLSFDWRTYKNNKAK